MVSSWSRASSTTRFTLKCIFFPFRSVFLLVVRVRGGAVFFVFFVYGVCWCWAGACERAGDITRVDATWRNALRRGTHTGDPHRGSTQGTHTEGRAPQRTHHRRGGPHRGPTQDTHRQVQQMREAEWSLAQVLPRVPRVLSHSILSIFFLLLKHVLFGSSCLERSGISFFWFIIYFLLQMRGERWSPAEVVPRVPRIVYSNCFVFFCYWSVLCSCLRRSKKK